MRAARAGRRIVMRPTEHGFVGPLAGELEEYIRFKASMGRHGATRVQVLRSFDRHCLEHGAVRLERGVVERWIAHRIDANPGGCRSWFSYIRDFGRWMRLAHDPDAYVLSDQWKAGSPRPTPYLLTDREAHASSKRRCSSSGNVPAIAWVLRMPARPIASARSSRPSHLNNGRRSDAACRIDDSDQRERSPARNPSTCEPSEPSNDTTP